MRRGRVFGAPGGGRPVGTGRRPHARPVCLAPGAPGGRALEEVKKVYTAREERDVRGLVVLRSGRIW